MELGGEGRGPPLERTGQGGKYDQRTLHENFKVLIKVFLKKQVVPLSISYIRAVPRICL